MKKRRVFISGPAKRDVLQVVRYIRMDKPVAAEDFKSRLKQKVRSFALFPQRGRKVPELRGTRFERYRELIVEPCRILYKIASKEVWVLRVLHSRREFRLFDE